MLGILRTREVEVAGAFKIGKSIEDINRKAHAEIDDLRRMVAGIQANAQDPAWVREVTEAVSANLDALERNFGRDLAQIRIETAADSAAGQRQTAAEQRQLPVPVDTRARAQTLEQEGFDTLLRPDLEGAIAGFAEPTRVGLITTTRRISSDCRAPAARS